VKIHFIIEIRIVNYFLNNCGQLKWIGHGYVWRWYLGRVSSKPCLYFDWCS